MKVFKRNVFLSLGQFMHETMRDGFSIRPYQRFIQEIYLNNERFVFACESTSQMKYSVLVGMYVSLGRAIFPLWGSYLLHFVLMTYLLEIAIYLFILSD